MIDVVRVRRTPVIDEYVENGASVVFVDGRLVVLSELATSVLAILGERGATTGELGAALVAEFGEPPADDRSVAVDALVTELEQLGLVTVTGPPAVG